MSAGNHTIYANLGGACVLKRDRFAVVMEIKSILFIYFLISDIGSVIMSRQPMRIYNPFVFVVHLRGISTICFSR